jgi:S1-C subfamily serine protease
MSNRQTTVTVLVVLALLVSCFNTYQLQASLSTQQRLNEENTRSLQSLQSTLSGLTQAAQRLGEDSAALKSTLSTTQGQVASLGSSISDLKRETSASAAAAEAKLNTLTGVLSELNSEVSAASSQLKALGTGVQDLQEEVKLEAESAQVLAERLDSHLKATPSEIYSESYRSVVVIRTNGALGSGFIYDSHGRIATNWHVVKGAAEVEVEYYDGTRSKARVLGSDPYSDTAVVAPATRPTDADPLPLGDSSKCYIGQEVVAIGNPLGLSSSLSSGIVSQINKEVAVEDVPLVVASLQLDVTIAPGNSGGPLLDMAGRVLGLNNAASDYGFNFAIPINVARRALDAIIEKGSYQHPLFGVSVISLNPDTVKTLNIVNVPEELRGLLIASVMPDYPAAKAGLQPAKESATPGGSEVQARDVIVAIDGRAVKTRADFIAYLEESVSPGQKVTFRLWRSGAYENVEITPVARPAYTG